MTEILVDARGLRCPLPVIRLAQAATGQPAGQELRLLSTDPATSSDVPAWCRLRGHQWLGCNETQPGVLESRVRLNPIPPAESGPSEAARRRHPE